jgi:hypothetical protein
MIDGDDNLRAFAAALLAVIQRSVSRDEGSPSCPALARSKGLQFDPSSL